MMQHKLLIYYQNIQKGENPFWAESYLLRAYKKDFPNKTKLELLYAIGQDLSWHDSFFKGDESAKRLKSIRNNNLPYLGRIYLYFIYEYFENYILRSGGPGRSYSFNNNEDVNF